MRAAVKLTARFIAAYISEARYAVLTAVDAGNRSR
jgi:hypothetical protein